jgi:2-polyprenyl-3-methyl-5-hydroxy-6-metoxy-1,4-benzoquinol methylase
MSLRWKVAQALEIRWWQRYLNRKTPADYLAWKTQYWQQFLTDIELHDLTMSRTSYSILDAGCGPAGIFTVLPAPYQVDALDPLLDEYAQKLAHFRTENYPNVQFLNQPLESLQVENKYDIIFCLNAINHVADLDLAFDRLLAAAKPNATIVISIDAHNYSALKRLWRLVPWDILHPHQYDLSEYEAILMRRGVVVEKRVLKKTELIFNYYVLVGKKNVVVSNTKSLKIASMV